LKAFILRLRERKLLIGRVSSVGGEEGALVLHQSGGGLVHHVEVTGLAGQLTPVGLDVRRDSLHQFVFQRSVIGGEIVESVARDPHHGGEGHEEADPMGPVGVLHGSILDWFPLEAVEEKDDPHDSRSDTAPAKHPV